MSEAHITINGMALTDAEATTLRVALNSFLMELEQDTAALGDDMHAVIMRNGYQHYGMRVLRLMHGDKGNQAPIDVHQPFVVRNVADVTIFGPSDSVAAAGAALEAKPLPAYPDELTTDLREVLGWPNFVCGPFAHLMRAAGVADIKRKAEDEQAHVLHWLIKHVLRDGANWRSAAEKDRDVWTGRAKAEVTGDSE
jgi:hypothetical protein